MDGWEGFSDNHGMAASCRLGQPPGLCRFGPGRARDPPGSWAWPRLALWHPGCHFGSRLAGHRVGHFVCAPRARMDPAGPLVLLEARGLSALSPSGYGLGWLHLLGVFGAVCFLCGALCAAVSIYLCTCCAGPRPAPARAHPAPGPGVRPARVVNGEVVSPLREGPAHHGPAAFRARGSHDRHSDS